MSAAGQVRTTHATVGERYGIDVRVAEDADHLAQDRWLEPRHVSGGHDRDL